jgi:hypothetical protein
MRYPIFVFDGDDLAVYETREEHWNSLEAYDIDYPDTILDSDGRLLRKEDAGNVRVEIVDSGADPDPKRLRELLLHSLKVRRQNWPSDSTLECLIAGAVARQRWEDESRRLHMPRIVSRLLKLLRFGRGSEEATTDNR